MKKLYILAVLALLIPEVYGQHINTRRYAVEAEKTIVSDDFESYSLGTDLHETDNWTTSRPGNDIEVVSCGGGQCIEGIETYYAEIIHVGTFEDDQYAELDVPASTTSGHIGPIVRGSTTAQTYYFWMGRQGASYLRAVVTGTIYTFATGDGFDDGDNVRLEIEGWELRCYKNGSLDTSIDTDGKFTVTNEAHKISSGNPGAVSYGNASGTVGDNFEGGDL